MDYQNGFNILLGLVVAGLGWFFGGLSRDQKELNKDLSKLREEIPKEYASKDDIKEIKETCTDIRDLLRYKVDK